MAIDPERMEQQAHIATLTMSPALDKTANVQKVVPEDKLRCSDPNLEPGGGGINVSRAIQLLGGSATAVYTAGGHSGRLLQEQLDAYGLEHQPIEVAQPTRENFIAYEISTTLQYRFGMPGAILSEPEWRGCLDALAALAPTPDYLVVSGSTPPGVPPDFYGRVAAIAREQGSRLIVDTSGPALRAALDQQVFLAKPNLRELADLAGEEIPDERARDEICNRMIGQGLAEAIVVSVGAAGAVLVTRNGCTRVRAPQVPIKSKIGAGDSMTGAMVLALARGWDLDDAVRFGVAAGSACVTTPGTGLCPRDITEHLYGILAED